MAVWRFKTEKEFEKELGKNFRCSANWNTQMDKFFGKPLGSEYQEQADKLMNGVIISFHLQDKDRYNGYWTIQQHMLTRYSLEDYIAQSDKMGKYATIGREKIEKEKEDNKKMGIKEMDKITQEKVHKIQCENRKENIESVTWVKEVRVRIDAKTKKNRVIQPTTTVTLKDGRNGIAVCAEGDEFSEFIGFCVAYAEAQLGGANAIKKIIKHFNGEEEKELKEKNLRKQVEEKIRREEYQKKAEAAEEKKQKEFDTLYKQIKDEMAKK